MWGVGPFGSMPYNYGGGYAGMPGAMSAGMYPYGYGYSSYGMPNYMQVWLASTVPETRLRAANRCFPFVRCAISYLCIAPGRSDENPDV